MTKAQSHTLTTDNAMLVSQKISRWSPTKTDRQAGDDLATLKKAQSDAGKYIKNLVSRNEFKPVRRAYNDLRTDHYKRTLAWNDEGLRLLGGAHFREYTDSQHELQLIYKKAADDFANNEYALARENAIIRLGELFRSDDYPEPSELVLMFTVEHKFLPIPTADDFRVSLPNGDADEIKKQIMADTQAMQAQATREAWERLHKVVQHMVDRLSETDAVFRNSLLGNVQETVDLLPALNIFGDPELDKMAEQVKAKLLQADVDELRFDPVTRTSVAMDAKELASKMSAYL